MNKTLGITTSGKIVFSARKGKYSYPTGRISLPQDMLKSLNIVPGEKEKRNERIVSISYRIDGAIELRKLKESDLKPLNSEIRNVVFNPTGSGYSTGRVTLPQDMLYNLDIKPGDTSKEDDDRYVSITLDLKEECIILRKVSKSKALELKSSKF
ncbi:MULTISPECIES: hypothetical protein [Clostridia]|uniref:hypothetical protein n=1 Tax=Clostridia TaxID=186801 RepID=UPI00189F5E93|nr:MULTISPECIES: hypothetical protein [Clostridia]MDY3372972.1 hypothetical protein [Terrisporobacter othiniensis]